MNKEPVYLRALDVEDLDRSYKWHADPDLYKTLGGAFRFVSRSAELDWLRQKTAFSNSEINLAICITETDEHIGNVYLRSIDWVARTTEVSGIFIGDPKHRGYGYGQMVEVLVLRHAFRDLGLNKAYYYILADNPSTNRIMEKFGFKQEGLLRQHAFKEGVFKDVYMYSVLAQEFFAKEEKLNEMVFHRTNKS